jgi:hypothetical protein
MIDETIERFRRDIHIRMFFADTGDSPWDPKQLFTHSDWTPDLEDLPCEFRARVSCFLNEAKQVFRLRRGCTNLLPYQRYLLHLLRFSEEFIVVPTDKNFGPVILERAIYIARVFTDHLIYRRLSKDAAFTATETLRLIVNAFLEKYDSAITELDKKFLHQSTQVEEPLFELYVTVKIY